MIDRPEDFLSDWFDGDAENLCEQQGEYFQAFHEQVAESLLVHGLLSDVGSRDENRDAKRIRNLMSAIDNESASGQKPVRRYAILVSTIAIAASLLFAAVLLLPLQNVSAGRLCLEKVIEAAARPFDRTYRVHVVEEYPRDKKPRNLSQEAWDREAEQQLDGATLFVRGADQYVLTAMLRSGIQRTTGSDGKVSWAFREGGPVHVSEDLNRFRGGVPGQQQDIPFMNIHSHLSQLQNGYQIELMHEQGKTTDGSVLSQLVGIRKSSEVRGPKQIEIWFDADNGTIHKMLLSGLPRGRGGPKSLELELIDQSDLAPDFFSHPFHHPQRNASEPAHSAGGENER
ncbi:hypothetical protein Q31b_02790 [Novipirellula aureliae]|uniref:Uncharacterized protein n=1 Tax=Novipirellula aureliae TaxID=2527966 RepID=A0A5C6E8H8_9BACT|nr:hypothetical protein [Novipirellula aureliae]TWU45108.1 hypothetical protein Q31b_02790 [Novipirellula aureliae]